MSALPPSVEQVRSLARRIREALANLGCAHVRRDGTEQRIAFRRLQVTKDGGLVLLEVDTERLPRGVRADELLDPRTLHHLGAVLHYPVRALNTTGITYAVLLDAPAGRARLPRAVALGDALARHPGTGFTFPLGEGPAGPAWTTLAGHFLVGGETGSGKTTWVLATVLALAQTNPPEALRVVVVDPKAVDFLALANLPHLARPIACEVEEAAETASWMAAQVAERRRLFLGMQARDLDSYNARAEEPLPRLLAVVDEVTDLALRAGLKSPFYRDLVRLGSLGRAFGIHLILATQNPKAEVLNTLIRGNLSARIAFRVAGAEHSRTILGIGGAERLPRIPGRMLARLGDGRLRELQSYQVGEEELAGLRKAEPAALLDGETKQMLRYAVEQLAGRFPQEEIMRAGWTRGQYRRAVVELCQAGLLTRTKNNAWTVV